MKNLLNLRWLHGSPNQTGETLTRENRLGIVTCLNPMRTLLITLLLLTLGVGQMWGAPSARYYLIGDPKGNWDKAEDYKIKTWYEKDGQYVFYIYANSNAYFRLKKDDDSDYAPSQNGETNQGYGNYNNSNAWKYNGNAGIVRFGVDETAGSNGEHYPWVFWGKVDIKIKHNWNNEGSWTEQSMTTNSDGTYTYKGLYSGSNATNFGIGSDGATMKYITNATLVGSPAQGDRVLFTYNSSGYKGFGSQTQNTGSATITKLCKITYDGNGKTSGTVPSAQSDNLYNTSVTLSSNDLTKTGYSHTGWNTETDGSGTHYNKGASITVTAANLTLYAEWTPTTTVITLNKNAQGGSTVTGAASVTAAYDAALPSFTALSSTNDYALTGYWTAESGGTKIINANGTLVPNVTISTTPYTGADGIWKYTGSALTLYAQWSLDRTLTYDGNEATSGSVPAAATSYANGANVTVLGKNTLAKTGYTFTGWNTAADGSGTPYAAGASITMNANYTLFAQWSENLTSVTLAASPSGRGSITIDDSPATSTYAGVATTPTVTAVPITGYFLTGTIWSKSNDNISLSADNTASTIITGCGTASTSSTLTASFTEKYLLCGSVNADENPAGGMRGWSTSGDNNAYSSVTYDDNTITIVADLTDAGTEYKCKIYDVQNSGWKGQTGNGSMSSGEQWTWDGTADVYFTTTVAGNYTFTIDISGSSPSVRITYPGEPEYSATLSINGHGSLDKATGTIQLKQYVPTTITATPETSYRFKQWTVTGSVACSSTTSATATFTATGAGGTITAEFTNDEVIYFDAGNIENEWGNDVYVTFLSANFEWNDGDGKDGALIVKNWVDNALRCVRMNRIPNTRIFYLDYSNLSGHGSVTQYVFFTSKYFSIPGSGFYRLNEMAAVTRGDYNKTSGNNMCVAENFREKDKNKTGYYCAYWMNYNDTKAGINLRIYGGTGDITSGNGDFTLSAAGSRTYTATVSLSSNTTYKMELQGYNGTYYKNNGTMVSTNCTAWPYVDRQATVGYITTTAAGKYKFTLNCADKLYLTADFPLAVGDYQVVYSGKVAVDGINETYSSSVIRHIGDVGTKKDTVSFFVVKDDSWNLLLQRCTSIDPITWVTVGSAQAASAFGNPATGTYNFVVLQDSAAGTPVTPAFATMTPEAYTGNYYIRTDAADGGWEAYKKAIDNQMIFSNYPKQHSHYDHYHCRYTPSGTNVKFCIANDYSARLSDTLYTDTYAATGEGILPADANVRFMWNSETNVLSRAYLNGSSTTDFLVLAAKNDSIKNTDGSAITKSDGLNQVKFVDKNNWVYQQEVQALEGTHIRLTSNYRFSNTDHIQYFKGAEGEWTPANTELLIGGTTEGEWHTLRLIYDFKTNNLVAAWIPPTTDINSDFDIQADMLLIRSGQNAAQQITFDGGSIKNIKTMIGAIEFTYDSIVGRVSHFNGDVVGPSGNRANRELMHYISFPFDVAVSDIFGIGQLNKEWYLQYYDGAERAEKGFFRGDGTTTFWKYMTISDTLRANVGYSLLLDNDYFNTTGKGTVWENKVSGDKVYLYFPSAKPLHKDSVISNGSKTITVPSHECTINRTFAAASGREVNHKFTDSHWNMMGVPVFQNHTIDLSTNFTPATHDSIEVLTGNNGYFFEWDSLSNTFRVQSAKNYEFKSMHAYMVQFAGTVTFSGSAIHTPGAIAARRAMNAQEDYSLELQLVQNGKRISRTYVELREEACDTFALNEDVYMMYSSQPADLFTFAGNYDVAANVLTVDNHTIPVGVHAHQAGTYTFTISEGFQGGATLIDYQTNTRTNLMISDYTVSLPKGMCTGRFALEIGVNNAPTAIDGVSDGTLKDGKAHKFLQNGVMYILQNGVMYDAQGKRVK